MYDVTLHIVSQHQNDRILLKQNPVGEEAGRGRILFLTERRNPAARM